MKKVGYLLAALVCCMLYSVPARADVIMEPMDAFYEEHSSECFIVGRAFTANGPDGKVILYKSPELPEVVDTWENGREVYIQFAYKDRDGIEWGVYDDYSGKVGWMPMDYMELIYDSISFQEDHAEEIAYQKGTLDESYLDETIFLWKYPGSREYETMQTDSYLPDYNGVYVDEEGNRWGLVGYYFGIRNVWLCLDAPDAEYEQLYPNGAPQTEAPPEENIDNAQQRQPEESIDNEQKSTDRIVPKADNRMVALAIVLVLAVAAGTAALLFFLRKKNSPEKKTASEKNAAPKKKGIQKADYDRENWRPILKCSICNGEQVAGFKNIHTGEFREECFIQNSSQLEAFKQKYGISDLPKEY